MEPIPDPELAAHESAAIAALRAWLREHPSANEAGAPLLWSSGMPVALAVLQVVAAIRETAK